MPVRGFGLEIKQVNDEGTFHGKASVYEVQDLTGDIVERGAFAQTLSSSGSSRPLLWGHDSDVPIGTVTLKDSPEALLVSGRIVTTVQAGKEALDLMRAGAIGGLSIGYQTVKSAWDEVAQARRLQEIRLWEVSLVVFPACEGATITGVKSIKAAEQAGVLQELKELRIAVMGALKGKR